MREQTITSSMENTVWVFLFAGLVAVASPQTVHKMAVRSDIRFRFANTDVTCVMSNDNDVKKELRFNFTLPKDAFIFNFSMEIEGKVYPGNVKKKEEAKKEYDLAQQAGHSAGLVAQSTRHSNQFEVSVSIAAGGNVAFNLQYQELLRRRFGTYEYSTFISPSDNIREFSIEVFVEERTEIKNVRTPVMRKDIVSNAVKEDQNTLTRIENPSPTTAYIVYKPTVEELKAQGSGWFVVQYDVESSHDAGDLLVVDGYFVHFFLPPDDLPPLPLDIIFVLDVSGSMAGDKLKQLKMAMHNILDDLRDTDRFNILLFDSNVELWRPGLQEASESNVQRAHGYVKQVAIRGATNLHLALMRGIQLLEGSFEASRVPMIFFLTDGEATAGEQNSEKIVSDVTKKNAERVNIYSLAFGAGADYKLLRQISASNRGFARKIYEGSDASIQVEGLYREISTIVLRSLNITYHSTSNNDDGSDPIPITIDPRNLTICVFPTMYGNSDMVVAGRLSPSPKASALMAAPEEVDSLKLEVTGTSAEGTVNFILEENDLTDLILGGVDPPFWTKPRDLSKMAERTWAFLTIKQLLEQKTASLEDPDLVKELDGKVLRLSLKYNFVTPLTSMVVTRPEDNLEKKNASEASFLDDEDLKAAPSSQQFSARRPMMRKAGSSYLAAGLPGLPGAPSLLDDLHAPQSIPMVRPSATHMPRRHGTTPTTTTRTTTTKRYRGKGRKGGRKYRYKKNRKPKKTCIRNKKVILETIVINHTVACYELRATRAYQNFTFFADPASNYSLTLTLKKRLVKAITISANGSSTTVEIDKDGNAVYTPASMTSGITESPNGSDLSIQRGPYVVEFLFRKKCKATRIALNFDIVSGPLSRATLRQFKGVAAKALWNQIKKRGRGRKNKRSKKTSRLCMSRNIPQEQSIILSGRKLRRYTA